MPYPGRNRAQTAVRHCCLRQAPPRASPLSPTTTFRPSSAQNRSPVSFPAACSSFSTFSPTESTLRRRRWLPRRRGTRRPPPAHAAGPPCSSPRAAAVRPRAAWPHWSWRRPTPRPPQAAAAGTPQAPPLPPHAAAGGSARRAPTAGPPCAGLRTAAARLGPPAGPGRGPARAPPRLALAAAPATAVARRRGRSRGRGRLELGLGSLTSGARLSAPPFYLLCFFFFHLFRLVIHIV